MPSADYFVASAVELDAACKGWRKPLDEPTMITVKNPFTGEPVQAKNYDPAANSPFPDDAERHVDFLGQPHADIKPVDVQNLALLMQAVLGVDEEESDRCYVPGRVGPPTTEEFVCLVPPELTLALSKMSDTEADRVVVRWIGLNDEFGVFPGVPEDQVVARHMLDLLRGLARQAVEGREMYCVIGP